MISSFNFGGSILDGLDKKSERYENDWLIAAKSFTFLQLIGLIIFFRNKRYTVYLLPTPSKSLVCQNPSVESTFYAPAWQDQVNFLVPVLRDFSLLLCPRSFVWQEVLLRTPPLFEGHQLTEGWFIHSIETQLNWKDRVCRPWLAVTSWFYSSSGFSLDGANDLK